MLLLCSTTSTTDWRHPPAIFERSVGFLFPQVDTAENLDGVRGVNPGIALLSAERIEDGASFPGKRKPRVNKAWEKPTSLPLPLASPRTKGTPASSPTSAAETGTEGQVPIITIPSRGFCAVPFRPPAEGAPAQKPLKRRAQSRDDSAAKRLSESFPA